MGYIAPGMNTEFFITSDSIHELLARSKVDASANKKSHYNAVAHITELWENSKPLAKERDHKHPYEKSDIEWAHKRTARLRLGSELYQVIITAKEMKRPEKEPNRLYHVRTKKIDK